MPSVNVSGVGIVNFPDGMSPEDITRVIETEILPASQRKPTDRTMGEAATDIYAGLKGGVGSLLQLPSQLAGVVGGEYEKPGQETGLAAAGKELRAEAEAMKSPGLKAREAGRAERVAEAEKKGQLDAFFTAFSETVKDPGLLTNFLAEQAPQLIPSLGAARLVAPLAGTTAAVRAAVGTGAVQQGADIAAGTYEQVYKELIKQGVSETEAAGQALGLARLNGVGATGLSILSQRLPGARALEEAFAGKPGQLGRILGGAKAAAGESVSEVVEETPARFLQNLAMAQVAPETSLTAGLGETAAMAALGGAGLGGGVGLLQRQAPREEAPPATNIPSQFAPTPEPEPEPPRIQLPPELPPEPTPGVELPPELPPEVEPPAPPVETLPPEGPPPPPAPAFAPPSDETVEAMRNYWQGRPEDFGLSFGAIQNRDRSKPASIQQMTSISAEPDYNRLSVSKDFGAGAPVVISDTELASQLLGRVDVVSASDGTKIPVQYAVIDAGAITPSNRADGTPIAYYADPEFFGIRPVAGNGRVAGLQRAFQEGTAQDYVSSLVNDPSHGINSEVIRQIEQPVLVRIMPKSALTPDIADKSNVGGQLGMSPTEQAKIDMGRFDLQGIEFLADGTPNLKSLRQFVAAMPQEEQANLMNKQGQPNPLAKIRLANALFARAYENDALIDLYAEATDPEAQQILRGMAIAAPAMSNLSGTGNYDVRQYVSKAAELAVNARRQNIDLGAYVDQGDIEMDPLTREVVSMFAANKNAPRRVGDALASLAAEAQKAYDETQGGPDLFGNEPVGRPLEDIFQVLRGEPTVTTPIVEEVKPERVEFVIDKNPAEIAKEIKGKNVPWLAQWLVDNAPNSAAKAIAEKIVDRITDYDKRGVPMTMVVRNGANRPRGELGSSEIYKGSEGIRFIVRFNGVNKDGNADRRTGTDYETIMHELLHVATQPQLYLLPESASEIKELQRLLNVINKKIEADVAANVDHPFIKMMQRVKSSRPRAWKKFGPMKNIHEVLTWGLTNPDYQNYISQIQVTPQQSAFTKFVDVLRKLLGLDPKYQTALEQVAMVAEELISEPGVNVAAVAEQAGTFLGTRIGPKQATAPSERIGKESIEVPEFISKGVKKLGEIGKKPGITPDQGFAHVDPDVLDKLGPIFAPEGKTFADKMDTYKDRTFQRLAQGIADQYRTIKDYSPLAYIKARMSKTVDGALEGLTFYGQVKLTDGALDIKQGTDGLVKVLEPIGNEVNSFLIWRALSRDFNIVEKSKRTQQEIDGIESDIQQLLNSKKEVNKVFEAKLKAYLEQMVDAQKVLDKNIKNVTEDQSLSAKEKRSLISSMEREFNKQKEEGISTLRKESDKNKRTIDQQVAVERATIAKLKETIKIPSISPEVVAQRNELAVGKIGNESRLEVYNRVSRELNKLNKSVLDVALEKGQIDKRSYETFLQDIYYIPFYKMVEEGQVADIRTASGLANQYFSKALKGGEKPFGDLMENLLRNWNHILSASMKNDAAVETIKAATEAGAAYPNLKAQFEWKDGQVYSKKGGKPIPAGEVDGVTYGKGELRPGLYSSDGKGLVKVMMNGYPAYYEVIDPLLVESIMSIGYMGPKSKFLDMAKDFKNILTYGVTLSPAFKVRNLIRDSVQSAAVSGIGLNIAKNVAEGIAASKKGNPDYISALAGGAIFNFGSSMEGDQARLVKRLVKQGANPDNILNTEDRIKNGLKKMFDAYQELGNRSEAANRMALYKQLRAKGFSHLEASFQARDLLDFSMQGAWPAVRLLTQVIPFLNPRLQGLYKLGRDGIIPTSRVLYNSVTGKEIDLTDKQKAQQFSIVTGAVVLASLMLYMAFKDDDEYKKREQWDRDNFWWFRLPGMEAAIRIPKPFEIGAIGTLAERLAEQMFDEGAEGRVFEQSMKRMLTDTFAINPIPQMIKPLVDLYANKDSFTGAPIETAGMERLSKAERVAINTSPLAKALSQVANVFLPEATEVSPVQADYAIKAYLGWMGATIASTSHYAVMPFSKSAYPDHNWTDTMSLGFVRTLPANQSGYVTSFYENMKIIEQSYADMRHYAELGQSEKVKEILEEKGDKIQLAKFYDKTSKDMAKVRQAIQVIQRDETMDGAQKREEIDRLKQLIGELAKQAEDVRKSLRQ